MNIKKNSIKVFTEINKYKKINLLNKSKNENKYKLYY